MEKKLTWTKIKKYFSKIKRKPDSHKGQNGKALIIGGSEQLVGAAVLAATSAMAAMRTGIDLCIVATLEKPGWIINSYSPDLIVKKFKGKKWSKKHLNELLKLSKNANATLIGNGMGKEKTTQKLIKKFIEKCQTQLIIDADAIRACKNTKFRKTPLITPHKKEFETLTGKRIQTKNIKKKCKIVRQAAKKQNMIVLLKGKIDIISDSKKTYLNYTGDPGMTKGGTGDILAGICTGLIALGTKPLEAACTAAYINGKIGEKLRKKQGYSYLASEFINEIPNWTKKIIK